jgi:Spy/CpxP family protein refolding chaperone
MKRLSLLTFLVFSFLMLASQVHAQQERGMPQKQGFEKNQGFCPAIPDLTENQKAKIKELHLRFLKESMNINNQLSEKRVKMKSLMTAEKADMNAINQLIDEIHVLKAQIAKLKAVETQDIRKELTEEQRILFDSKISSQRPHCPDYHRRRGYDRQPHGGPRCDPPK